MHADLVIPSLDAGDKHLFQYVNRPHHGLSFDQIVEGLVAFTSRFKGEVWLEVLLLAGVTGRGSEAEKIAALAKRVGAARVQLNTASRPPAEDYAFALPAEEMLALKSFFPGFVEIISERERDGAGPWAAASAADDDILALLSRRPCTPVGVATGLGIHVTEAVKHLDGLLKTGKVATVLVEGRVFYAVAGQTHGPEEQVRCHEHLRFPPVARDHAVHPRNCGPLKEFNGHARITGPCGDTMEFWVMVRDNRVRHISFITDGCGSSLACGSMGSTLAEGKPIGEVLRMRQQDILDALGGLPPNVEHCALLSANTIRAACEDYLRSREPIP